MKSRIKVIVSSFVLLASLSWQGCDTAGDFDPPDQDYFVKYYGTSLGNQTGVDLVVNPDGTIIIVGISEIDGLTKTYFLKLDPLGNVLAEKYLSGPKDLVADIEALGNDTYLILSEFVVDGSENTDVKLLRVNGNGDKLDSVAAGTVKTGIEYNDHPRRITVLSTGKIIVSGSTDNIDDNSTSDPDFGDFLSLAFSANPNLVHDPSWGFGSTDLATGDFDGFVSAFEGRSADNEDIVCAIGVSSTALGGPPNVEGDPTLVYVGMGRDDGVIKDPGVLKDLPVGAIANISDAIKVESINGGYFFVGSMTLTNGKTELYFGKLQSSLTFDPQIDLQFHDRFLPTGATNLSGVSVSKSNVAPEGYLIAGIDTKQTGSTDTWALKIDLSGQVVWTARFGSDQGDDTAARIVELPNGKVMILGTTELGDNQRKLSLIKVNSSGQLLK
jgi:hypothetical protein